MSIQERDRIAGWLEALQLHEYFSRKYRFKGDAWYELKNERFSMEYHHLAAEEERKAEELAARLEDEFGPGGSIDLPDQKALETIEGQEQILSDPWGDEGGDFEDACFYARYPLWAEFMPKLLRAYERWKADPRFLREAPKFLPVNPSWKP